MVLAVALLLMMGLLCLYQYEPREFSRQVLWIVIGVVGFCGVNLFHYRRLGQVSYALFIVTLCLLTLILVGKYLITTEIIPMINGAYRWISLSVLEKSIQIQPSEIAKLAYILALAWYLRLRDNYRTFKGLLGPFLLTLLPMALILLEPDLGTVLLFLPILFTLLFIAGARIGHLLIIVFMGSLLTFPFYVLMPAYQQNRIKILIDQWRKNEDSQWLMNDGFQLDQSKTHIGTGQWLGYRSKEKERSLRYELPHRHNDFIFALIAHQWGFAGGLSLIFIYVCLVVGGIEIAASQPEPFGRLIAVGICALFTAQMFINIGMTMGLTPITGLTLPFVSYGGSSLITNFLALGLLTNVARHRPYKRFYNPFEFDD